MLDRTDFESWQQAYGLLYCLGKDNDEMLWKVPIKEGPFPIGTVSVLLLEGQSTHSSITILTPKTIGKNVKMILEGSGVTKDDRNLNYTMNLNTSVKSKEETFKDYYFDWSEQRKGIIILVKAKPIKCPTTVTVIRTLHENVQGQATSRIRLFKDKRLLMLSPGEWCSTGLEKNSRCFSAGEQLYECDAFDLMLSEESPSHRPCTDLDTFFRYDQYMEDNEDHVVQRDVSSVRNDALMSILDECSDMGFVQSRLANKPDMIVNDSVTSELARYKELVGEYEKRAKFEFKDEERSG
ncbi:hypothetical protein Tco_0601846 [Tanacetum coccineum]